MSDIYLYIDNEKRGPFSQAQVSVMYNSGSITAETLFWREGQLDWVPIDSLFQTPTPKIVQRPVQPVIVQPKVAATQPYNLQKQEVCGLAICSLVFAFVFFPVAIITGHIARGKIKDDDNLTGDGMAIAGLILGYIQLGIVLLLIASMLGFLYLGSTQKGTFTVGGLTGVR